MNEKKIGQAIAKARIARHMTPRALAEKLMVDDKTVIAWETGDITPTESDLAAICEALELPCGFFAAEAEEFSTPDEENAAFEWKDQRAYWEKKWKEDNKFYRYGYVALLVVLVVGSVFLHMPLLNAALCFVAIGGYLKLNNDKMTYIESKVPMKDE